MTSMKIPRLNREQALRIAVLTLLLGGCLAYLIRTGLDWLALVYEEKHGCPSIGYYNLRITRTSRYGPVIARLFPWNGGYTCAVEYEGMLVSAATFYWNDYYPTEFGAERVDGDCLNYEFRMGERRVTCTAHGSEVTWDMTADTKAAESEARARH